MANVTFDLLFNSMVKVVQGGNTKHVPGTGWTADPATDHITLSRPGERSITIQSTDTLIVNGVTLAGTQDENAVSLLAVFNSLSFKASGSITTQNLVPTGAATAGSAVEIALNGASILGIQVAGTYTGALSVQITMDGTTWVTIALVSLFSNSSTSGNIASGTTGVFFAGVQGGFKARVSGLAAMTGTATVTLISSQSSPVGVNFFGGLPSGSNTIGIVNLAPSASQGFTSYHTAVAAASNNATNVKASGGTIGMISIHNKAATPIYVKIFNKATSPTVGTDTPVFNLGVPAAAAREIIVPMGIRLGTGISYAITGGQALLDNTSLSAGDAVININYL